MDFLKAKNREDSLGNNNRQLIIALLCSVIASAVMAIALVWTVVHKTVIVVPAIVTQQFSVSATDVDSSYLNQFAEWFVYLRFNTDPGNVAFNHNSLEEYISPEARGAISSVLNQEESEIMAEKISSTFSIDNVEDNTSDLQVKIYGKLNQTVGNLVLKPQEKVYVLSFNYSNGRLFIKSFIEEKKDDQAQ